MQIVVSSPESKAIVDKCIAEVNDLPVGDIYDFLYKLLRDKNYRQLSTACECVRHGVFNLEAEIIEAEMKGHVTEESLAATKRLADIQTRLDAVAKDLNAIAEDAFEKKYAHVRKKYSKETV